MKLRLLFPMLAAAGAIALLASIIGGAKTKDVPQAPATVPVAYVDSVIGLGTVEAAGGSISVGAPVAAIVTTVKVKPGEQVRAGVVLFQLDDSDVKSQRPLVVATIDEALERQRQARQVYDIALGVPDQRAVSKDELAMRSGAVKLATAVLASARARLSQLVSEEQRRIIRAPIAGTILQVNLRPGEVAPALAGGRALILMAPVGERQLRVDVDEFEASRVQPGAHAVASPRGRPTVKLPLVFERIEPVIGPKANLAGTATERVDTRVLQVIYRFASDAPAAYIGQQMDVAIDAGNRSAR
ncbi:MAG: efflux RND transporter periplasmic adaptor subunit [Bdellovibrionales bacterium]|nr:efflux RND transporter periplasmic adaptor subunit [Massilia sp.]